MDIYVDNHPLLTQGPPAIRTSIRDHAMYTTDSCFKPESPCNPYDYEPISTKN